ncbi:hypothetical protein HPB49_005744 [Dermacentor silvarum]|uniref:Uncharacterized protein n=1 Tax=Dermacentor silvarum TaxID=543639 RepID=A0ACB8DVN4_DERSI|nr:hypothetical protein HPB49_005744 [Dermacentor silvarum]
MLDKEAQEVPDEALIILDGDLNGHVGETADGNRSHGGKDYDLRNNGGDRVLDFADAHDLVITNGWFWEPHSHLVTYYCDGMKSQIDPLHLRALALPKYCHRGKQQDLSKLAVLCEVRRAATKAVAGKKTAHYAEVYEELDTREDERHVCRLVKRWHLRTQDNELFHCIPDEFGQIIADKRATEE